MVLDWALLSEVDSAVFVQMQPLLVIQNLHPCDSHTCETALLIPWAEKKPNFSKRNISTRLLGILSSSDLALSDTKKNHQTPTQKPTHQNPEQGVDMFIFVP